MTTSCGDTSSWHNSSTGNLDPSNIRDFPDLVLGFMNEDPAPPGCSISCKFTIVAKFPFTAAIVDGDSCQGQEQVCSPHATADYAHSPWTFGLELPFPVADRRPKTLIIDRVVPDDEGVPMFSDFGDTVTIDSTCGAVC